MFKKHRIEGEWFLVHPDIKAFCRKHSNYDLGNVNQNLSTEEIEALIKKGLSLKEISNLLSVYLEECLKGKIPINKSEIARKFDVDEGTVRYRLRKLEQAYS